MTIPPVDASSVWKPGVNVPPAIRRRAELTAPVMFFIALETRQPAAAGVVRAWSVSEPIARTPALQAAWSAPSPVALPVEKITSAPLPIMPLAAAPPWAGSLNESV